MKKTYTYNELKGFINEELENFNHIIESKHIFNAEFNKYRKFFKWITKKVSYVKDDKYDHNTSKWISYKRPIHPAFDTYTNYSGRRIELTKENVVDLDITQLYKDFPNFKKDQELLLSLKPNVRSGKRPKNLEKDYEAERLRKAQLEDKATCGICHDYWEQVDMNGQKNIIADHGFFIGLGQRNNVCFGARFHAWEKSPESKIQYVKQILKPLLEEVLKEKPQASMVERVINRIIDYKKAQEEYRNLPNGMAYKYRQQERDSGKYFARFVKDETCPEDIKKVHAIVKRMKRPCIIFSGQQVGEDLPLDTSKITLELLVKIWSDYKDRIQADIQSFETAIKNWKLQPTPKERK
tara:strand:- start:45 stop:1100 length:1056 start_codon:yes stop_codon:yes gene_type:complete